MTIDTPTDPRIALARRLTTDVLAPLKSTFVGKDEIVDLLGICLVGGENLFILGPPGTAKSAIVHALARRIEGRVFDYLLTRFTEPSELFGPFDIRKLREGDLVTNTDGMLPEASLVFLDELLNANSAILNSLLAVLNERVFRRGRETRRLPLLAVVGASNRLPEDDALAALFDRFLLRVRSDNVSDERLDDVLAAGWRLDVARESDVAPVAMAVDEIRRVQSLLADVDLAGVRPRFVEVVRALRRAGVPISDRRGVKLQRLIAASCVLCGRLTANATDLWILRHVWDTEEQREVIAAIVDKAIDRAEAHDHESAHPRSRGDLPDPESLAREIERLEDAFRAGMTLSDRAVAHDRLGLLTSRTAWVQDGQQRGFLEERIRKAWEVVEGTP
jgi:MoxR-like ATPase